MDVNETLKKIQDTAPAVAAEYDEHQAAIAAERDAEAKVLETAIEAARPALRAISDRIRSSYYHTGGRNGCNPVKRITYHAERGVLLCDDYTQPKDETGNRGSYEGSGLYLLTDGRLAVVARDGSWSQWQGEPHSYEQTLTVVTPREAMDEWKLDEALEALAEALEKQRGKRDSKAARERAERLAALATLSK